MQRLDARSHQRAKAGSSHRINEPMNLGNESMQGLVLIETEVEGLEWTA